MITGSIKGKMPPTMFCNFTKTLNFSLGEKFCLEHIWTLPPSDENFALNDTNISSGLKKLGTTSKASSSYETHINDFFKETEVIWKQCLYLMTAHSYILFKASKASKFYRNTTPTTPEKNEIPSSSKKHPEPEIYKELKFTPNFKPIVIDEATSSTVFSALSASINKNALENIKTPIALSNIMDCFPWEFRGKLYTLGEEYRRDSKIIINTIFQYIENKDHCLQFPLLIQYFYLLQNRQQISYQTLWTKSFEFCYAHALEYYKTYQPEFPKDSIHCRLSHIFSPACIHTTQEQSREMCRALDEEKREAIIKCSNLSRHWREFENVLLKETDFGAGVVLASAFSATEGPLWLKKEDQGLIIHIPFADKKIWVSGSKDALFEQIVANHKKLPVLFSFKGAYFRLSSYKEDLVRICVEDNYFCCTFSYDVEGHLIEYSILGDIHNPKNFIFFGYREESFLGKKTVSQYEFSFLKNRFTEDLPIGYLIKRETLNRKLIGKREVFLKKGLFGFADNSTSFISGRAILGSQGVETVYSHGGICFLIFQQKNIISFSLNEQTCYTEQNLQEINPDISPAIKILPIGPVFYSNKIDSGKHLIVFTERSTQEKLAESKPPQTTSGNSISFISIDPAFKKIYAQIIEDNIFIVFLKNESENLCTKISFVIQEKAREIKIHLIFIASALNIQIPIIQTFKNEGYLHLHQNNQLGHLKFNLNIESCSQHLPFVVQPQPVRKPPPEDFVFIPSVEDKALEAKNNLLKIMLGILFGRPMPYDLSGFKRDIPSLEQSNILPQQNILIFYEDEADSSLAQQENSVDEKILKEREEQFNKTQGQEPLRSKLAPSLYQFLALTLHSTSLNDLGSVFLGEKLVAIFEQQLHYTLSTISTLSHTRKISLKIYNQNMMRIFIEGLAILRHAADLEDTQTTAPISIAFHVKLTEDEIKVTLTEENIFAPVITAIAQLYKTHTELHAPPDWQKKLGGILAEKIPLQLSSAIHFKETSATAIINTQFIKHQYASQSALSQKSLKSVNFLSNYIGKISKLSVKDTLRDWERCNRALGEGLYIYNEGESTKQSIREETDRQRPRIAALKSFLEGKEIAGSPDFPLSRFQMAFEFLGLILHQEAFENPFLNIQKMLQWYDTNFSCAIANKKIEVILKQDNTMSLTYTSRVTFADYLSATVVMEFTLRVLPLQLCIQLNNNGIFNFINKVIFHTFAQKIGVEIPEIITDFVSYDPQEKFIPILSSADNNINIPLDSIHTLYHKTQQEYLTVQQQLRDRKNTPPKASSS
jgi:hypothetical protein